MDPFGTGMKRPSEGFENDPKRQKLAGASKVLHVRGLPSYTTEAELVAICAPFGQIYKTLILQEKHQAFVQMESVEAATNFIASLEYNQPNIRSKDVYFQFSSRQEIQTNLQNPHMMGGMGGGEGASCVLIIAVSSVSVPVTLENIHQVCKPYGDVLKIITFNKGMDFQALVQFATVEQATNAKLFLDGKDLFQGCCHLRLSYSKRQTLTVKQNDHKSRDFTMQQGMGNHGLMQQMGMAGMPGMGAIPGMPSMGGYDAYGMPQQQHGAPCVVLVNKLDPENTTPDMLFTLFGVYGDVIRVKILFNKRDTALVQFASSMQARHAQENLNGCPLLGQHLQVSMSKHLNVQLPKQEEGKELTRDYTGSDLHRFRRKAQINTKNVNPPSIVLHVANLHENATEQELRDLFGAQQPTALQPPMVEFFKTSRNMAYVCMASVDDAVSALINLHNYTLHTYNMRVSFSHKDPANMRNSDEQPMVAPPQ